MSNSTNNLFYQLYSNDKNSYVSAGYSCSSATNEADTSFDISDSKGVITDSNGDTLASIDLSGVHAAPTSEYSVQTKIMQPYTSYLLQGNDFGLSYAAHYFKLVKELEDISNYANYCDVQLDITYSHNFETKSLHINTIPYRQELMSEDDEGDTTSVWTLLQKIFDNMCLPITIMEVSEKDSDCECCDNTSTYLTNTENQTHLYIKFLSSVLGFQFIVRNLRLVPIYQDEHYPDSPFSEATITTQDIIDAIKDVNDEWTTKEDISDDMKKTIKYIDCDVYVYILEHLSDGLKNLDDDNAEYDDAKDIDSDYIKAIYKKVYELTGLTTLVETDHKVYKLLENLDKEIPAVKYPNGAFRGLFIVPTYPSSYDDQAQSLMVTDIRDFIDIYNEKLVPINSSTTTTTTTTSTTSTTTTTTSTTTTTTKEWITTTTTLPPVSSIYTVDNVLNEFVDYSTIKITLFDEINDVELEGYYNRDNDKIVIDLMTGGEMPSFTYSRQAHDCAIYLSNTSDANDYLMMVMFPDDLHDEADDKIAEYIATNTTTIPPQFTTTTTTTTTQEYPPTTPTPKPPITAEPTTPEGENSEEDDTSSLKKVVMNYLNNGVESIESEDESEDDADWTDNNDSETSVGFEVLYKKEIAAVMAASRNQQELSLAQENAVNCHCVTLQYSSNGVVTNNYDNEWIAASNPYEDVTQFRQNVVDENDVWIEDPHDKHYRDTHIENATTTVGLYGYLKWCWDNNMWTRFGQFYGIITQADDENTKIKNLHPSVFLYNPNNYPIKVNIMMF